MFWDLDGNVKSNNRCKGTFDNFVREHENNYKNNILLRIVKRQ